MVSMEKQFKWVLEKFSSLEENKYYSPPFSVAGCNWRVLVYPKGKKNKGYLRVYLELADPSSLPPGWSRDVKFSLAVVPKGWDRSNIELGDECCFSAKSKSWGFDEFMSLTELHAKGEGFLRNDKLVILAKLHVLPPVVGPEGFVKSNQHLSGKEGNQASGVSVSSKSLRDPSSQMDQKLVSMGKKFVWVVEKFSSLEEKKCYSRPFFIAGCNWRLVAYPKGKKKNGYLGVYLELADPSSLPPGWSRDVEFSLTVVTKGWGKSNIVLGDKCCFSAKTKSWGYDEFMSLTKLHAEGEGFLRNDKLFIIAVLHVLPAIIVPEVSVKNTERLSPKEGSQASGESVSRKMLRDSSSQMEQKTEKVSEEGSDGDDDTTSSDEGSDGDTSSDEGSSSEEGSDSDDDSSSEEGSDASVSQSPGGSSSQVVQKTEIVSKGGSDKDEVHEDTFDEGTDDDVSFYQVEQKSENVSKEGDDESKEGSHNDGSWEEVEVSDDASSPVSDEGGRNRLSLMEVSNGDNDDGPKEDFDYVSSHVTNDGAIGLSSSQAVDETLDVNGFRVLTSQVESVSRIFKRHPDIALGFRPKNQRIRSVYMNELLTLIEMLCKSPEKLSEDDLSKAEETLCDLTDVGFKLDWLKTKLTEVSEKKKKEQGSVAKIQTMEEELQKLKLMFLDLETQLQKEKVETSAARAPLSFDDVVCCLQGF